MPRDALTPVLVFLWLILAVAVLSVVGAGAGWDAVNPVTRQSIQATSLLSSANLERLLVEMPRTLPGFALQPLHGAVQATP